MKLRLKLPYWLVSRLNGEHKAAKEYRKMQEQHIKRRMAEARQAKKQETE